jgi:hypothetical protein
LSISALDGHVHPCDVQRVGAALRRNGGRSPRTASVAYELRGQHPRALRLVRALADELMRHETLGGGDVRRVLERADERRAGTQSDVFAGVAIEPWPILRRARLAA